MNQLTPEARAIIDAASVAEAPPARAKKRIHAAILAGIATGAAEGTAGAGAATASAAAGWGVGLKLLLPLMIAGFGAGGAYVAGVFDAGVEDAGEQSAVSSQQSAVNRSEPPPATEPMAATEPMPTTESEPMPTTEPEPAGSAEPAPVAEPAPEPKPKKIARAKPRPKHLPAPVPALATASSIAEEMRLIGRARKALGAGDNAAAVAIAAEHAQRFPSGQLTQERDAVRVRARCNRGDANARGAAEKFLARWPKSPYAAQVRGSCKLEE